MDHQKVAQDVLEAVGKDNIIAATHCATRLRLVLQDDTKVDEKKLDENDDIKGTFKANGQYQIIIGAGDVNDVYKYLIEETDIEGVSKDQLKKEIQEKKSKKQNVIIKFITVLSDIFVPIIPALVAGGLLMALNNVLTAEGLFNAKSLVSLYPNIKGFADFVNVLAAAPFSFLPVLIGFSAVKRFGGNPYLGAAMGMVMVSSSLVNGYSVASSVADGSMTYWNIFGFHVAQAGYQGTVFPILVVSYILAQLEKKFHKWLPAALDFTFTPMLTIIITGILTFTFVGPIMRVFGDSLTNFLVWMYNTTGPVGTGVLGLFYSPIVITGLHQSFPPIETALLADIAKTGGSFLFPIAAMANIGQGAATLAVFFTSKDQKQKNLALSGGISALLGITEPAIFGVNLKLRYPFFCAMIASGIASIFTGLFNVLSVSQGPAGIIGFICIKASVVPQFLLCSLIAFAISFVLTFIYARKHNQQKEN